VTVATDTQRAGGANDFSQVLSQNGVAVLDFRDYAAVSSAIAESRLVVTATGVKGALDRPQVVEALLGSHAVLANMGVEDEYGPSIPSTRVLAEKKPLNFILEEPTHLKYIDASLALHAALGELLVREAADGLTANKKAGPLDPPSELEQRILSMTMQDGLIGPEIAEMLGW
jgi:adenosylhomocysteinase